MGKQLFGTDGIRGRAGDYPLDRATVHAFGMALGRVVSHHPATPEVVIGWDTRESSEWIAAQVAGGLNRLGASARFAGLITTPGIAYLTRTGPFVAGVMISASHNPFEDNGLKVFGHSGYKIPDEEEHCIEEEILRLLESGVQPLVGGTTVDPGLDEQYVDNLLATLHTRLDGMRVVLDCGNGAASGLAPGLFERGGASVVAIHNRPDGRNINLNCGALYTESLRKAVVENQADLGVAFDGDADRAIFVAETGSVVDGDAVLLIAARSLKKSGRLQENLVVATVMSNLGLEKALEADGIRMLRTPVGDKYVLEEMLRTGGTLGGEQSGHVIFLDYSTTGDGMLTALRIAEIVRMSGLPLSGLASDLKVYPQRLVNIRVKEKKTLLQIPRVAEEIRACEEALAGTGRILVRFSGTEPLARVMVEAEDPLHVEHFSMRIAKAIEQEIG